MIAISDITNKYGTSMALIMLCCRIHFKTAEIDDLNTFILNNNTEWSEFIKNCRIHRIRALVYRVILKANLVEDVKKRITNELNTLTIQSFEQAKETERLIYLLQENKIDVVPYKGTAFSKQFFGNISMRESSDIDLVVNPDDIPVAIQILENDGFIAYQKEYYNWIGHTKFIKNHKDFSFDRFNGSKRIHHVELHFNIINKSTHLPDNSNTFDNKLKYKTLLFQREIECLNPIEHYRAVALHHMLMDNMGYLKTVIDITQVLVHLETLKKNNEINPSSQFIIEKMNSNYNLALIQNTITKLIGIHFIEKPENKTENAITKRILNSSYRKVRENKFPLFDAISFSYFQLKYTSQFYNKTIDKIIYLLKNILSISYPQPEDYMSVRLNKNLYFLYYFIRPFRLIFFPGNPSKK